MIAAQLVDADFVLPMRTRHRQEMNCQVVHDLIHRRPGWTKTFLLELDSVAVGFGLMAIGGPWAEKPALLEFYLLPEHRRAAYDVFTALVAACGAKYFEIQSNDALAFAMTLAFGKNVESERIVFRDELTTALPGDGITLHETTPREQTLAAMAARQGGGEWRLELDGATVATGGLLFHYNVPYGDVYMDVPQPSRRRGYGSYLVQELKQIAYELGAIPAARCNPANEASRRTLIKAGFTPYAHMLIGELAMPSK
jgi:GNAT superfamily N-acetyltransferase